MSPDKLFDYLDDRLPDVERAELEARLSNDEHLQRELKIARKIHSGMQESREILTADDATSKRGAVLARRLAIVFSVLVFLNVFVGVAFIIGFNKKPRDFGPREAAIRKQLAESMEKAAVAALPTPTFDIGEIKLTVPPKRGDATANEIVATAKKLGGSATKGLADANGILVFAEVPEKQTHLLRMKIAQLGSVPAESRIEPGLNGKTMIQLRIVENAKP
jgi:hypothetical protein